MSRAATSPDAELIAVANEMEQGERLIDRYNADPESLTEEALAEVMTRTGKLGVRLMGMRAVTAEGLRAKAGAVRWTMVNAVAVEPGSTVESLGCFHERLAWSLVNDMVAAGDGP